MSTHGTAGPARYVHTNLVALDWRRLADFYIQVFGCEPAPPARQQSGDWLANGTGVPGASLEGMHLRLPGFGGGGPTLEIFTWGEVAPNGPPVANRQGYGHLAFAVEDVDAALAAVLAAGGGVAGAVTRRDIPGVGLLTFVYAADPEGNVIELQRWT